jgi:hypothetical protein
VEGVIWWGFYSGISLVIMEKKFSGVEIPSMDHTRLLKSPISKNLFSIWCPETKLIIRSRGKALGGCSRLLIGLKDRVLYYFRVQGRSPWWVQQTAARGQGTGTESQSSKSPRRLFIRGSLV